MNTQTYHNTKDSTFFLKTPSAVEVLIHCNAGAEPHPRRIAPAVREALQGLLAVDAIKLTDQKEVYQCTDLGKSWMTQICSGPFPLS